MNKEEAKALETVPEHKEGKWVCLHCKNPVQELQVAAEGYSIYWCQCRGQQ